MKGKTHEMIAEFFAVIFAILFFLILIGKFPMLNWFIQYFGKIWFFLALLLFILGSILPDSDAEGMNSRIFFKKAWGIGYLFKGMEFFIAPILNRKRGHRESLHTIFGIILTSLILMILFSIILGYLGLFQIKGAILCFIFLFFGQLLHLFCDAVDGLIISWR